MPQQERGKGKEKGGPNEGVKIVFSQPELLRAYILDHSRIPPKNFAEQTSGIRESILGEFPLDGHLFRSVQIIALIEAGDGKRSKDESTAIIRANLKLGDADSGIKRLQEEKMHRSCSADEHFHKIQSAFETQADPRAENIGFFQYGKNTANITRELTQGVDLSKTPLIVVQLWDKDTGLGVISVSLVNFNDYRTAWRKRIDRLRDQAANCEEFNDDLYPRSEAVDSWRFDGQPVGITVNNEELFRAAIEFYEEAFPRIFAALYQTEGIAAPNLYCVIEAPLALEDVGPVTFADIGGQHKAVEQLQALAILEQENIRIEGMNRMVLLAGPPGTGKSSLTQALAAEYNMPLITKTSLDIPPKADQEAVQLLLDLGYYEAKSSAKAHGGKAVYCLEGLEVFLGADAKLHDIFLNKMERWNLDPEVLFMATTNFPEQLHPGITRRFTAIPVSLPDKVGREEILKIRAAKIAKMLGHDVFGQVDFGKLAIASDKSSGSDLTNFLAVAYALRRAESQKAGRRLPIDTDYLLSLRMNRRIGFITP
ncbi:MAG: AAA family ATPase [bacterium]|nr:AAA family ATPase [bacterium]